MLEEADRYSGYTAYDYLEAGKDYREFRYAKQIGRVPKIRGTPAQRHPEGAHRAPVA